MTLVPTAGPVGARRSYARADLSAFRSIAALLAIPSAIACANSQAAPDGTMAEGPAAEPPASAAQMGVAADATCEWRAEPAELAERASPPDSVRFAIGDGEALLCYSRPSARGRTMIGGEAVPFGEVWRTGANEPTTLHLGFAAEIAGVMVGPGVYSIYTVPGESSWEIIVNRSTAQWGAERYYTAEIEAQEAGRGTLPAQATDQHVETMTFRASPDGPNAARLVMTWEGTRIVIPIRRTG
ncbi:MAG TPA: DUF2911 domain-containing protein [Longimicrobiales bacterium]|nr:DUF2911 domain-containing protein [Longimicrobiales bacterium]